MKNQNNKPNKNNKCNKTILTKMNQLIDIKIKKTHNQVKNKLKPIKNTIHIKEIKN